MVHMTVKPPVLVLLIIPQDQFVMVLYWSVIVECSSGCLECSSQSACTECKEGYYMEEGLCVEECSDGYLLYLGECLQLDSCPEGYVLHPDNQKLCESKLPNCFKNDGDACLECNPYYYVNQESTCSHCTGDCVNCLNATFCEECPNGQYLFQSSNQVQNCIENCKMVNPQNQNVCNQPCENKFCLECNNSFSECTQCIEGYYYIYDQQNFKNCQNVCPNATYSEDSSYECQNCLEGCEYCKDYKTCERCSSELALLNSESEDICLESCPLKYYKDSGVCQRCVEGCSNCSSKMNCYECEFELLLISEAYCIESCEENYTYNSIGKICLKNEIIYKNQTSPILEQSSFSMSWILICLCIGIFFCIMTICIIFCIKQKKNKKKKTQRNDN